MPLIFDVPTTLAMSATSSLTMAVALLAVRRERRDGLGMWAVGLLVHALAYGLLLLRSSVYRRIYHGAVRHKKSRRLRRFFSEPAAFFASIN